MACFCYKIKNIEESKFDSVDVVDGRTVLHTHWHNLKINRNLGNEYRLIFFMHLKHFTNLFDILQLLLSEEKEYLTIEYQHQSWWSVLPKLFWYIIIIFRKISKKINDSLIISKSVINILYTCKIYII
jgi:hypothetical protein